MEFLNQAIGTFISSTSEVISSYLPKLVAGFLVFFIGLVVASLVKDLIAIIFKYFRISRWLEVTGLVKEKEVAVWPKIIAEIARWIVIFFFLMSAVEIWGVPKVGEVLSQLLLFLPNVFVAVIIGLAGLIAARFTSDIVRHGVRGLGNKESLLLATIGRYSIIFFTTLIILTQLGVAADLVKILFTGIVAMLVLAFGLAFGLGGQEEAKNILKSLRYKINEKDDKKKK
jgi:hypothetical protein